MQQQIEKYNAFADADNNKGMTLEEKKKAAYALNLCTVSVSQIIDYEDLNVLEQEYESILNNLNIQNMPKDEALLHILKLILDTITFFRIQEGDKKILERRYKDKMTNAIWNAVPNFGIFAAGDPCSFALSLLVSAGMGYMNYRKEKNNIFLEHEANQWQLQRSAIEQFNGLRRELFDTAWRLAKEYDFDDSLRLTENQISQYNKILIDPIPLRRYERLCNIKDRFGAYPPFWYYLANSAMDVVSLYKQEGDSVNVEKYISKAKDHYEKFLDADMDLLRDNYIRSACDLEYAGLLIDHPDKNGKYEPIDLVDDALKHCGSRLDIIQTCAMCYLRLNNIDQAEKQLRKLVVEDYNAKTNSQLLSFMYLGASIKNERKYIENTSKYKELLNYVGCASLVPWIESYDVTINHSVYDDCVKDFISVQIDALLQKYMSVVEKLQEVCAVKFNKTIYRFAYNLIDDYFYDTNESIKLRISEIGNLDESGKTRLLSNLKKEKFSDVLDSYINSFLSALATLVCNTIGKDLTSFTDLKTIEKKIEGKKTDIKTVDVKPDECSLDFVCKNLTYSFFLKEYLLAFERKLIDKFVEINNYHEILDIEYKLEAFCRKEGLPSLEELCRETPKAESGERLFLDVLSCVGINRKDREELRKKEQELIEAFEKVIEKGNLSKTADSQVIFTTDPNLISNEMRALEDDDALRINNRGRVLAYYKDETSWYEKSIDIFFMKEGVYIRRYGYLVPSELEFHNYSYIEINVNKQSMLAKDIKKYNSSKVDFSVLSILFQEGKKLNSPL